MSSAGEDVNDLIEEITHQISAMLGDQLVGLYLYGSLVTGGFDPRLSDLDLLAATGTEVNGTTLAQLRTMHDGIAARYPDWYDRIEVAYLSRAGLRTFREHRTTMGIISPGEPLHQRSAGPDWLMNWYLVREKGRALLGPPAADLIAPITWEEFLDSLRDHARWRSETMSEIQGLPPQSYSVLTMGRTLRAHCTGDLVPKVEAARWVAAEYPRWAELMNLAVRWRAIAASLPNDDTPLRPDVLAFVQMVAAAVNDG